MYQLPALLSPGTTVVITPLLSVATRRRRSGPALLSASPSDNH